MDGGISVFGVRMKADNIGASPLQRLNLPDSLAHTFSFALSFMVTGGVKIWVFFWENEKQNKTTQHGSCQSSKNVSEKPVASLG